MVKIREYSMSNSIEYDWRMTCISALCPLLFPCLAAALENKNASVWAVCTNALDVIQRLSCARVMS